MSIEQTVKLLKGESSHWLNQQRLTLGSFHWQRGYGAFSVCPAKLKDACEYITRQESIIDSALFWRNSRRS